MRVVVEEIVNTLLTRQGGDGVGGLFDLLVSKLDVCFVNDGCLQCDALSNGEYNAR